MNTRRFCFLVISVFLMVVLFSPFAAKVAFAKTSGFLPHKDLPFDFMSISFADQNTGWVAGKLGIVFKTDDGGLNWKEQKSGVEDAILSIKAINAEKVVGVGFGGVIISTDDGGKTWTTRKSPVDLNLLSVGFFDEMRGIAVGDWGKMILTEDGGKTWTNISLEEDIILNSLFINKNEAWVAAEKGVLFHSLDAGKNWERIQIAEISLFAIAFDPEGMNGVAVGMDGLLMNTTDGGKTWQSQTISDKSLYEAVMIPGGGGLVIGDCGRIYGTSDSGKSWNQVVFADRDLKSNWLQCLVWRGDTKFIIGGKRGSIRFIDDYKLSDK